MGGAGSSRDNIHKDNLEWMNKGNRWMEYAVNTQLLNKTEDPSNAVSEKDIQSIVARLKDEKVGLPGLRTRRISYSSPGSAFWDLFFLADIGFGIADLGLEKQVEGIFQLQQEEGSFVLQSGMKPRYHCISAIVVTSLAKMGYNDDPRINKFIKMVIDSQRLDGGWHCSLDRAIGSKLEKSESCPMDNLNLLMLLGQYVKYRSDSRFCGAIDLLLEHWSRRAEPWRPYGFGIGSQFVKLRYPEVKYGILRVLDVLSLFPYAAEQPAFHEMLKTVEEKARCGRYHAESVSRAYSQFDFGQTKEPSKWITFLIRRIQQRSAL